MQSRVWVKRFLLIVIGAIFAVYSINLFIDPIWVFSHKHKYNSIQYGFDERLQKSVALNYHEDISKIDTLLFGSSRTTFYNQNRFYNMKVYNYAFSSAKPYEFVEYLNFAKKLKKGEFKNIILGLDFFGIMPYDVSYKKAAIFKDIDKNSQLKYALTHYLSFSALKYAYKNFKNAYTSKWEEGYTRDNIKLLNQDISKEKVISNAFRRSKKYYSKKNVLNYNENYSKIFEDLIVSNKNSKFIVYTTPLSSPFLYQIYSNEQYKKNYFRWIRDMVDVFGKVYFFTMPSELAYNFWNYSRDGDHYYPFVCDKIIDIISQKKQINGYGIIITKDNLEKSIKIINNSIKDFESKYRRFLSSVKQSRN